MGDGERWGGGARGVPLSEEPELRSRLVSVARDRERARPERRALAAGERNGGEEKERSRGEEEEINNWINISKIVQMVRT